MDPLHPTRARLVLDTNVVLDWLYFADPRAATLQAAVHRGNVCWMATPAMHTELRHVLARDVGRRGSAAIEATLEGWRRWAELVELAHPAVPSALRCTDPDDQMFVDLGWRLGGAVLLSSDRAVLRLSRRAAPLGLTIATLDGWTRGRQHAGRPMAPARGAAPELMFRRT